MEKKNIHIDEFLGALLLGAMSLLTFVNVMNRYFLKNSIAFTEEITINFFVWITLLGISVAFRRGTNLKMTNFFDILSPKTKRTAILVGGLLGAAVFIFIIFNSVKEIHKNMTFYKTTSESLGIPTWIYSLGTPIFSGLVIREILRSTLRNFRDTKVPREEK